MLIADDCSSDLGFTIDVLEKCKIFLNLRKLFGQQRVYEWCRVVLDYIGAMHDLIWKHSGGIWSESPSIQVIKGNLAITTPEKQLATVNQASYTIVPTNTKKVASI